MKWKRLRPRHIRVLQSTMPQRMKLRSLHIWLVRSTMPRWMKRRRLLTIIIWQVDTGLGDSVLIWDMDDDGQRGEAEDEDSLTSDPSILCIHGCDLLILTDQ